MKTMEIPSVDMNRKNEMETFMYSVKYPLHHAVMNGDLESVICLLKFVECDINETDDRGLTAVEISSLYFNTDIFVHLLSNGA